MKDHLVSVIIPCYNYGIFIDDAINSIMNQTYSNIEIIIVDSGSDDHRTLRKLKYIKKKGIKVIFLKNKIFPSTARNIGFREAKGNYILPLDADDILDKTFIEKAIKCITTVPECGAVSCTTLYFGYEDGMLFYTGGYIENILYSLGSTVCALIRREVWEQINGFDEEMVLGYEDWDFWIRMTKKGWRIDIIPETLFFYRQKEASRVQNVFSKHEELYDFIKVKHADVYTNSYQALLSLISSQQIKVS